MLRNSLALLFKDTTTVKRGVSATHLDVTMIPYVQKSFMKHYKDGLKFVEGLSDEEIEEFLKDFIIKSIEEEKLKKYKKAHEYAMAMTEREVKQAAEGLVHNLNTLQSRSGNQLPFTSINYGLGTELEARMVTKAILETTIKGIGKLHRTATFPCQIFQMKKGINTKPGEPNYDLYRMALQSTSLRLYPNYANCDWSVNAGYNKDDVREYVATMGCHAPGTKILMADGSFKNVEEVTVGDKLMGVSNDIRTVQKLIHGKGKLYKVHQSRGEDYVVNDGHVLALMYLGENSYKGYSYGDKVNMRINDLIMLPENIKQLFYGYRYSFEAENDEKQKTLIISVLTITDAGEGDFYGFELDGDRLYMINDCTVTHNCRTYNGYDINGMNQMKDGRGNICPVTLILPTLAMEAGKDEEKFMKLLDKKIHEAKDMLIERFHLICKQPPESARFMYENNVMYGYIPEEGTVSALKHGTLAIGQLGLAETLQLLVGCDHTEDKGMVLAQKIEQLFNKRCKEFKNKYKLNFGVYYTPVI